MGQPCAPGSAPTGGRTPSETDVAATLPLPSFAPRTVIFSPALSSETLLVAAFVTVVELLVVTATVDPSRSFRLIVSPVID